VLVLGVFISACQTDTPAVQQDTSESDSLKKQLDSLKKALDSVKNLPSTPIVREVPKKPTVEKKKKKPSPVPSVSKNEPKQEVVPSYTAPIRRSVVKPVVSAPTSVAPPPTPSSSNISNEMNSLKAAIQEEKNRMLQAKEEAQAAEALALATTTYEEALATAQTAEEKAAQLNSTALKEAKENFISARELFQNSAEEAAQVMAAQSEADNAKAAMITMRKSIGNGSRNPTTLASYKEAIALEKKGDGAYESNQFEAATKTYWQAENLYKTAKSLAAKQPKQPGNSSKIEERKIQLKIDNYGELLEVGDIQGLLQGRYIKPKERRGWASLFSNVENITIRIDNQAIDIKGNKATASFSVKMFFQNKTNNKVEESSFSKNWELERREDRWMLVD